MSDTDPAAPMRLRPDPPRVTRLSRKVLAGVGAVALLGIGGALIYALQTREAGPGGGELYSIDNRPAADGLEGLLGALVWDIGEVGGYTGPLGFGIAPVAWSEETYLAVGLAVAATAPTTMAELYAAEHQFGLLVRRVGFGVQKVSTHYRTNDQAITDGTDEARTDSQHLNWCCSIGTDRMGAGKWWHHWPSGGSDQDGSGTLSAALTTGHRLCPFIAWGSRQLVTTTQSLVLDLTGRPV